VKLAGFASAQAQRLDAVSAYQRALGPLPDVALLETHPLARHGHHLLVVRVPHRDRLLKLLHDEGVGAAVHYPVPIHLQAAMPGLGGPGAFPAAEALSASVLSLPLFPGISPAQVARVVDSLARCLEDVA
jgi:dTDP-4-amino-4,6-dideoxygalactose transaminase